MWGYLCFLCRSPGPGESGQAGGQRPGYQGEALVGGWSGLCSNSSATNYLLWVVMGVTRSEPVCLLYEGTEQCCSIFGVQQKWRLDSRPATPGCIAKKRV